MQSKGSFLAPSQEVSRELCYRSSCHVPSGALKGEFTHELHHGLQNCQWQDSHMPCLFPLVLMRQLTLPNPVFLDIGPPSLWTCLWDIPR